MEYKGWDIDYKLTVFPRRVFDYIATPQDYDGAPDAEDNRIVHAASVNEVKALIDEFIDEQSFLDWHKQLWDSLNTLNNR